MMGYKTGEFCWSEIYTTNVDDARGFYGEVLGWTFDEMKMGDMPPYLMFHVQGKAQGGMCLLQEEHKKHNVPPHWLNFLYAEDVDDLTAKAKNLGATIQVGPMAVGEAGKMSIVTSPTGETFALWKSNDNRKEEPEQFAVGKIGWRELLTKDVNKSKDFYTKLFGYKVKETDMGPMGKYYEFQIGDETVSGMMDMPKEAGHAPSHWGIYFNTDNHDETATRIKKMGGDQVTDAMDVPEVGRMSVVKDPQGAYFNIIQFEKK